jgi:hypothetical protein
MSVQDGDLVRVKTYGGRAVVRRAVEVLDKTVLISTDEECKAAAKERREPICIGFPLADVIEVVEQD